MQRIVSSHNAGFPTYEVTFVEDRPASLGF